MTNKWQFFRAGGFDQVSLNTGEDIAQLADLDMKLWVALSCPVKGISFEKDTLSLLDSDGDGHVRAKEVIEAAKWAASQLSDPSWLAKGSESLPLSAISGEDILRTSKHILKALGKEEAEEVGLQDCMRMKEMIAGMPFNGDGMVPLDAARDEEERGLMRDIFECRGGESLVMDMIESFFDEIGAYAEWMRRGNPFPFPEETERAAASWSEVSGKVEDFFRRCRLIAFDPDAALSINRSEGDFAGLASLDLSGADAEIAAFPIAKAGANRPLPLEEGLNPLWIDAISRFKEHAVVPLAGERKNLTEAEWLSISSRLGPYMEWKAGKPCVSVEKLGDRRIMEIATGEGKAGLVELICRDLEVEPEVKGIASVEKLLRYCRDLYAFANNFVSFRDFYTGRGKAIFQAGTLYLDGRSCELCVTVEDVARHAQLAGLSRICLVYCDLRRGNEKMTIAAGLTSGDSDQLMPGRNGVFYDREGLDWDATVVRIIDHPISIRQAFMSPYKNVGKLVGEQIQKMAASRMRSSQEGAMKAISDPGKAPQFDAGKFAGIFAAFGLAVGAIGTAVASMVTGLLGLKFWQVPIALFFLVMAVSGPSMLIAWLKLRQRNLGPILDANGWAVNARAKINIPFGASLTALAKLPENSGRMLADPYAEKRIPWLWFVLLGMISALLLHFFLR